MSYGGFLLTFLAVPLLALVIISVYDVLRRIDLPIALAGQPFWRALLAHAVLAVVYTTPWDNLLVVTGIWWHDPERVVGLTVGWVPLEEYGFFILQTCLTGFWWLFLARRLRSSAPYVPPRPYLRTIVALAVGFVWTGFAAALLSDWQPVNYLAMVCTWALLPLLIQIAFGADILWHYRRLVLAVILAPTLYLAFADAIAVDAGTWVFNPRTSTGWLLGGVLPVEELVFFLLTNTLIGFGMTLVMSEESQLRWTKMLQAVRCW